MDNNRRFLLAIALSAVVLVVFQFLFPSPPAQRAAGRPAVTAPAATAPATAGPTATAPGLTPGAAPTVAAAPGVPNALDTTAAAATATPVETVTVAGPRAAYQVSAQGAALVGAEMRGYKSLRPGADGRTVQLARPGEALLAFRLVTPGDTVALSRTTFRVTRPEGANVIRLDGVAQTRVSGSVPVSVTYSFVPDSFMLRVSASAQTTAAPAYLLIDLPPTLATTERDTSDHFGQLSFAWKPKQGGADAQPFGKLDPGERRLVPGPLSWAVMKSKYFLVGLLAPASAAGFTELALEGGPRTSKVATQARGTLVVPAAGGVTFDLYAGPQEWRRLAAMGRDFEQANPYGGWFQGIVQPFATLAMRVILGLHDKFGLGYGWILVFLGIVVRLVLWPLQQNMMRNQIRMQRIQPELQLVQQRHKNDPQQLQQEMMKVYASHGMTPFAPLTGCLPMLLPMPIFFALFFVFQNTIEFRGVPFLWLGDISLKDPFYVLPVLVAATQFLISWIGMRGAPPNPQAQTITYMMPAMFLIFFINVAAGLNLYYLTQNLVMIPQQWLLARERVKAGGTPPPPPVEGTPVRSGAKNPKLRPA
jgi:YidC/Oxa1 family membrane protein insertase